MRYRIHWSDNFVERFRSLEDAISLVRSYRLELVWPAEPTREKVFNVLEDGAVVGQVLYG